MGALSRAVPLSSWWLLLFVSVCVAAQREPFNGAVHADQGRDAVDDGMTEAPFSDGEWKDISLGAGFVTRPSWQVWIRGEDARDRRERDSNRRDASRPVTPCPGPRSRPAARRARSS